VLTKKNNVLKRKLRDKETKKIEKTEIDGTPWITLLGMRRMTGAEPLVRTIFALYIVTGVQTFPTLRILIAMIGQ